MTDPDARMGPRRRAGGGLPASGRSSEGDADRRLTGVLDRVAELIAASPHNLVSRAERARLREVHIAEAVHVAGKLAEMPELGGLQKGASWVDLGTGGGLPGLVLAALHPQVRWTLIDSVGKKTAAVSSFVEDLRLTNVEVVTGRAEELARRPDQRERHGGVIARAVAALPVLLELARGFVEPGGYLVAIKGPRWDEELDAAADALRLLRWSIVATAPVDAAVRPTWLVTLRAEGRAPAAYPRDVGIPRRQPLGGPPL